MGNLYSNIETLCQQRGITITDMCKESGASRGSLTDLKKGRKATLALPTLQKIADYFGVSIDSLNGRKESIRTDYLRAIGPAEENLLTKYRFLDARGKASVNAVLEAEYDAMQQPDENVVDFGTIRHYLYSPACGVNGLTSGEDYEDIPRTADMPDGADFCLTVSGDSMEPYIHDGDMVFVNESARLQDMDVGVFSVDGATYVKQYAPLYDGSLMLLSANPERESANIRIPRESSHSVQYFGKVILPKKLPQPFYK